MAEHMEDDTENAELAADEATFQMLLREYVGALLAQEGEERQRHIAFFNDYVRQCGTGGIIGVLAVAMSTICDLRIAPLIMAGAESVCAHKLMGEECEPHE